MILIESISSYLPKNKLGYRDLKKILGNDYKRILNYTGFKKIYQKKKKPYRKNLFLNP